MKKGLLLIVSLVVLAVILVQPGVAESKNKIVYVKNESGKTVDVFVIFGDVSEVKRDKLPAGTCTSTSFTDTKGQYCGFQLANNQQKQISVPGLQVNGKVSFYDAPGCHTTLGEFSLNMKGSAGDSTNVSAVDGYKMPPKTIDKIQIRYANGSNSDTLGPNCGTENNYDNSKIYGVFPWGCNDCIRRVTPLDNCKDYPPAGQGCHAGGSNFLKCQLDFNPTTQADGTVTIVLVDPKTPCKPAAPGARK
jgi:hypothetical protein